MNRVGQRQRGNEKDGVRVREGATGRVRIYIHREREGETETQSVTEAESKKSCLCELCGRTLRG